MIPFISSDAIRTKWRYRMGFLQNIFGKRRRQKRLNAAAAEIIRHNQARAVIESSKRGLNENESYELFISATFETIN
jgi:hypothetical protein